MKLISLLFIINSLFSICYSQGKQKISFIPVYNGQKINLNEKIKSEDGSWIEIQTLRFYISHLSLTSEKSNWIDPALAHLIDLEDSTSFIIDTDMSGANSISFMLGIDSLTNVSGILDGDLDPIKGMYWSWNSGYINFKLEGRTSKNVGNNGSFEYHIGGYLPPFETVQHVVIPVINASGDIQLEMNIFELLNSEELENKNEIMIPGKEASSVAKLFPLFFKIMEHEK